MSWDNLKLPTGRIALVFGALLVYATGLVVTGELLWIVGAVNDLTGGNALLVIGAAFAGLILFGMDARHRKNSRKPREHSINR